MIIKVVPLPPQQLLLYSGFYYFLQQTRRKQSAETVTNSIIDHLCANIAYHIVHMHDVHAYARVHLLGISIICAQYGELARACVVRYCTGCGLYRCKEFELVIMATSCEPNRCSAYSDDLRSRMVYQRTALGLTYREIAANLCVDWRFYSMQNSTAI